MKLNEIFKTAPELEIEQLSIDSRVPMKNAIFFCLNGIKYDGHDFIDEAIDNGATVVVYSKDIFAHKNAIYIKVNNVNECLANIADIFYNHPNDNINEYVVSGCYGRSTISSLIKHYLDKKTNCGYIGVQGIIYKQTHLSVTFPALTSLDNLKTLSKMKQENIVNCVFESSPISLYYRKLDVLKPSVFVYSNTSKYCGDYRACGNHYYEYLRRYLYSLEDHTCVLFNKDDVAFEELKDCVNNYATYGFDEFSTYRIVDYKESINGISFNLVHDNKNYLVDSKLLGKVHTYNLSAAIASLHINGYDIQEAIDYLNDVDCIPGVMEKVACPYNIIIDCASDIDSLNNVLSFAKKNTKGKTIGVIGINYSDDDKRIKNILKLADEYLDVLYVTEDESEDADVIDILDRLDKFSHKCNIVKAIYRSIAIELAVELMNSNDTLLVLGKGSESYMHMGLGKQFYSGDKHFVLKYIEKRMDEENEII